jgi:hypothetical protein
VVAGGGNEFWGEVDALRPRLYLNDGRGGFARAPDALPGVFANAGCVVPGDYDGDGRVDLFVGGACWRASTAARRGATCSQRRRRAIRGRHDAGRPGSRPPGWSRSAAWADTDGDGRLDLVVAGEWMPVRVFRQTAGGRLVERTAEAGLAGTEGWWTHVSAADLDGDGRPDLVLGNAGENLYVRASRAEPMRLYVGDFLATGTPKAILTSYRRGVSYPLAGRDELVRLMPALRSRYPSYAAFGAARLEDILPRAELARATVREARELRSMVAMNGANGTYTLAPLPVEAQFAPVRAAVARDLDGDGRVDLLLAGNDRGFPPVLGRADASAGLVLRGVGDGRFTALDPAASGLTVDGEVRHLALVRHAGSVARSSRWRGTTARCSSSARRTRAPHRLPGSPESDHPPSLARRRPRRDARRGPRLAARRGRPAASRGGAPRRRAHQRPALPVGRLHRHRLVGASGPLPRRRPLARHDRVDLPARRARGALQVQPQRAGQRVPPGTEHTLNIRPKGGRLLAPVYAFGEARPAVPPLPEEAPTSEEGDVRITFRLDLREVLRSFRERGYYDPPQGERIAADAFTGAYVIGDVEPLSWDLRRLRKGSPQQLEDPDGDGIYDATLRFRAEYTRPRGRDGRRCGRAGSTSGCSRARLARAAARRALPHVARGAAAARARGRRAVGRREVAGRVDARRVVRERARPRARRARRRAHEPRGQGRLGRAASSRTPAPAARGPSPPTDDVGARRLGAVRRHRRPRLAALRPRRGAPLGRGRPPRRARPGDGARARRVELPRLARAELPALDAAGRHLPGRGARHERRAPRRVPRARRHGRALGERDVAARWRAAADTVRRGMQAALWQPERGYFGQFRYGRNALALSPRAEALGEALTVLYGVATPAQRTAIVRRSPLVPYGTPTFWPYILGEPLYHNGAIWPFVGAYWTWAAAEAGHTAAVEHGLAAATRAAALFLTNKENLVAATGHYEGTALNSDRQLWSVAGTLAAHYRVLFGMRLAPDRLVFRPMVPPAYGGERTLRGVRWRGAMLTVVVRGWGDGVRRVVVDGQEAPSAELPDTLTGAHTVELEMNGRWTTAPLSFVEHRTAPALPRCGCAATRSSGCRCRAPSGTWCTATGARPPWRRSRASWCAETRAW